MELITTYICKKGDIGVHDNMFGGTIMSLIDDAAASYVAQICDTQRIVTLKINELVFKKPVKVGSILKIYGQVVEFGNTSVTHTKIVFVRIDDEGKSLPIHQFVKDRYWERIKIYGKGLLGEREKNNDIYNKK